MIASTRKKIALARRARAVAEPQSREALTRGIRDFVLDMGVDLVGIASVDRFDGAPQGHHPLDWLPDCRSVVVFALRQLEAAHDWPWMMQDTPIATDENRLAILDQYWILMENHDVHDNLLDQMALRLALHLQRLGYRSLFHEAGIQRALREVLLSKMQIDTPHGLFSLRHAAVRAGLGEFGLNNLVITPEYGPHVRFVAVLTEADLIPNELLHEKVCLGLKCGLCVELCREEVLTATPEASSDEVWLNPPARTDRPACTAHRHVAFCNAQCVARCPIGLPMRAPRKRLHDQVSAGGDTGGLPVVQQVAWPASRFGRALRDGRGNRA